MCESTATPRGRCLVAVHSFQRTVRKLMIEATILDQLSVVEGLLDVRRALGRVAAAAEGRSATLRPDHDWRKASAPPWPSIAEPERDPEPDDGGAA